MFDENEVENAEITQRDATDSRTPEQVTKIAFGGLPGVGTLTPSQPKCAVICLASDANDDFKTFNIEVISPFGGRQNL